MIGPGTLLTAGTLRLIILLGATALAGCASYASLPLVAKAGLAPDLSSLHGAADLPGPLDVAAVARLAVLNSPDLQAARTQHGAGALG